MYPRGFVQKFPSRYISSSISSINTDLSLEPSSASRAKDNFKNGRILRPYLSMSGDKGTRKIGRARDRNRITELPLTESISNDWHRLDLLYATSDVRISLSSPPPFPPRARHAPSVSRVRTTCRQRGNSLRNVAVMRKGRRNTRVCTHRARNGPIYSEPARGYSRGWASISESNRNLLLVLEPSAAQ